MDLRLAVRVLVFTALLLVPASADAAVFCVHDPEGCSGTPKQKLQDALDAANANGNSLDQIYLGVGLFNDGKSTNVAGSPVDIIGVAANKTALTANAGVTPILDIQEPTSEIRDLRVHAQPSMAPITGVYLRGTALRAMVTNQGVSGQIDGVRMLGGDASFRDGAVSLVYPANLQNRAIFLSSATDATITDSYLAGTVGVSAANSSFSVRRARINATQGVVAGGGSTGEVRDTAIEVPGPSASNFQNSALAVAGNGNTSLTVNRVTAYSSVGNSYGVWTVPNGGAGNNSNASVRGSLFYGFTVPFRETQPGGGSTSTLAMNGYSAYDFTKTGPEVPEAATDFNLSGVDPKIDTNIAVFALSFDSPLIDRGDPAVQPPSGFFLFFWDVFQQSRVRDGDGDGNLRVDIGAFEYQRRAPTAVASALIGPDDVTFFGDGSSDPDLGETDQLTYDWEFDDGATATGETVTHAFATGGSHDATLTVTDPAGLTGTATVTVSLNAIEDPGDPGDPGNPADPTEPQGGPPVISDLSLTKRRVRPPKGTTIQYTLSEPADVTFRLARRVRGRRVDGKCRRQTPENRSFKRCRRWKKAGKFVRPGLGGTNAAAWDGLLNGKTLKRGRYRMTARAKDSTGARSNKVRTRFRIVRPRATL